MNLFDRVFFKFVLVGVINTAAGSAIMFALYNAAGVHYPGQRFVVFREGK